MAVKGLDKLNRRLKRIPEAAKKAADKKLAAAYSYRQRCATALETFIRPWLEYTSDGWMHTHWNQVRQSAHDGAVHPVWAGVPDGSYFYFVHSFYARPSDARHSAGETEYGVRFTSALARDNIFATQFHPEKSADFGLALYRNFLSWKP